MGSLSLSDSSRVLDQYQLSKWRLLSNGARLLPNSDRFQRSNCKWLHNQHKLSNRRSLCDKRILSISLLLSNPP